MKPVPDEIWHQIFAHFECVLPEDSWWTGHWRIDRSLPNTLTSICLVSRQFCRVAQPLLFRTIIFLGQDQLANDDIMVSRQHQYSSLIRTLAASPRLGLETRAIALSEWLLTTTPDLHSILQNLVPSLDIPTAMRKHMERVLERSDEDIKFGIAIDINLFLLALMPRIRLVDCIHHQAHDQWGPIWMMSGRADAHRKLWGPRSSLKTKCEAIEDSRSDVIRAPGLQDHPRACFANFGLPNLEEIRIRKSAYAYYDRLASHYMIDLNMFRNLEAVLLHPNLKTLRLREINWKRDSTVVPTSKPISPMWPDEPCGVQFLELRQCDLDASSLRHILTRFKNLRTLIIYLDKEAVFSMGNYWVVWHLDEFGSALRDLGQNLVDLNLDTHTGNIVSHLGSLRKMQSLRHLNVALDDLVDDSGDQPESIPSIADLPLSIETLLLKRGRHCACVVDKVRKLLEFGHMPSLRQVCIEGGWTRKQVEGEFDGPVAGWDMTVRTGLWRTIGEITFTKGG